MTSYYCKIENITCLCPPRPMIEGDFQLKVPGLNKFQCYLNYCGICKRPGLFSSEEPNYNLLMGFMRMFKNDL